MSEVINEAINAQVSEFVALQPKLYKNGALHMYGVDEDNKMRHISHLSVLENYGYDKNDLVARKKETKAYEAGALIEEDAMPTIGIRARTPVKQEAAASPESKRRSRDDIIAAGVGATASRGFFGRSADKFRGSFENLKINSRRKVAAIALAGAALFGAGYAIGTSNDSVGSESAAGNVSLLESHPRLGGVNVIDQAASTSPTVNAAPKPAATPLEEAIKRTPDTSKVHLFGNDTPGNEFGPAVTERDTTELKTRLYTDMGVDPILLTSTAEKVGVYQLDPATRAAKIKEYMRDAKVWDKDFDAVIKKIEASSNFKVTKFTGKYVTSYQKDLDGDNIPELVVGYEKAMVGQDLFEFTLEDGTVVKFKLPCHFQPVEAQEAAPIAPAPKVTPRAPEVPVETTVPPTVETTVPPTTTPPTTRPSTTVPPTTTPPTTVGPTTTVPDKVPNPPVPGGEDNVEKPKPGPSVPTTRVTPTTRVVPTTNPNSPTTGVRPSTTRPPIPAPTSVVTTAPDGPPPSVVASHTEKLPLSNEAYVLTGVGLLSMSALMTAAARRRQERMAMAEVASNAVTDKPARKRNQFWTN